MEFQFTKKCCIPRINSILWAKVANEKTVFTRGMDGDFTSETISEFANHWPTLLTLFPGVGRWDGFIIRVLVCCSEADSLPKDFSPGRKLTLNRLTHYIRLGHLFCPSPSPSFALWKFLVCKCHIRFCSTASFKAFATNWYPPGIKVLAPPANKVEHPWVLNFG